MQGWISRGGAGGGQGGHLVQAGALSRSGTRKGVREDQGGVPVLGRNLGEGWGWERGGAGL